MKNEEQLFELSDAIKTYLDDIKINEELNNKGWYEFKVHIKIDNSNEFSFDNLSITPTIDFKL